MNDQENNHNNTENIEPENNSPSLFSKILSKVPHIIFVGLIIYFSRWCIGQENYMDNFKSDFISVCDGTNQYLDVEVRKEIQNTINTLNNPSSWDDYCECAIKNITSRYTEEDLQRIEKKTSGDLSQSEIEEFYGEINSDNYENKIAELTHNDSELKEFFRFNDESFSKCLYILN